MKMEGRIMRSGVRGALVCTVAAFLALAFTGAQAWANQQEHSSYVFLVRALNEIQLTVPTATVMWDVKYDQQGKIIQDKQFEIRSTALSRIRWVREKLDGAIKNLRAGGSENIPTVKSFESLHTRCTNIASMFMTPGLGHAIAARKLVLSPIAPPGVSIPQPAAKPVVAKATGPKKRGAPTRARRK